MNIKAQLEDNVVTITVTVPAIQEALEVLRQLAALEQDLIRRRRDAERQLEEACRILTTTKARNTVFDT